METKIKSEFSKLSFNCCSDFFVSKQFRKMTDPLVCELLAVVMVMVTIGLQST